MDEQKPLTALETPVEPTPPTTEEVLERVKQLANPKCKKCFGRGYVGFDRDKNPLPCMAKRCAYHNFRLIMLEIRRQELAKKLEKTTEESSTEEKVNE